MQRAAPSARLVPVLTHYVPRSFYSDYRVELLPIQVAARSGRQFSSLSSPLCIKTRIYLVIGRNFARPALNLSVRIPKVLLPSVLPFRKYRRLDPKGKLAHKETLGKKPGEGERHSWNSPILSIQGCRTSFLVFSRFFFKIFQKRLNLELASGQR